MPDYKQMYLKMFRASEKALNLMIAAQRECEELYTADLSPELRSVRFPAEDKQSMLPEVSHKP